MLISLPFSESLGEILRATVAVPFFIQRRHGLTWSLAHITPSNRMAGVPRSRHIAFTSGTLCDQSSLHHHDILLHLCSIPSKVGMARCVQGPASQDPAGLGY